MKFYLCCAFVFIFTSCNIPKDGEQENIPTSKLEALTMLEDAEDSTKKEKAATSTTVNTKPILIARGSEPGWYAEFFNDHLLLIADYGKDTISVKDDFSDLSSSDSFNMTYDDFFKGKEKMQSRKLLINLEAKSCTEASGGKREKSISIQYDNKTFKGCAHRPE